MRSSHLIFRRLKQVVLLLAVIWTVACSVMIIGAVLDDVDIARHKGTATATVLSNDRLRVNVAYQTPSGSVIQPDAGLIYPTGLDEGQRVRVEYSTENPEKVKVAGRSWTLSILPALTSWIVGIFIAWALGKGLGAAQRWWNKRHPSEDVQ